jgi:hypothetical protein
MPDALATLEQLLLGRRCEVQKREFDWNFYFGEGVSVTVGTPWRIVTSTGIAHGDEDDSQRFGLPQPVDGEARANQLLGERRVISVKADELTADLTVVFDGDVRLDLFNHSSGYEGWQATLSPNAGSPMLIAKGGGGFSVWSG